VNLNGKKGKVFSPYFLLKGKVQEGNNWSGRWVHHNLVSYLTHANMVSAQKGKENANYPKRNTPSYIACSIGLLNCSND